MRFFSNEAKDNVDDQDVRTDAVPQQRPGSPWDDRPGESPDARTTPFGATAPTDDRPEDRSPATDDDRSLEDRSLANDEDRSLEDRSLANDEDRSLEDRSLVNDEERDRANDDTVAWPSGETTVDRDRDGTPDHDVDVPLDDHRDDLDDDLNDRDDNRVDATIEDRGTFDEPHVAGHRADDDPDSDEDRADDVVADRVDEDRADENQAEQDLTDEDRGDDVIDDRDRDITDEPAVVAAEDKPAEVVEPVTEPEVTPEPVVAVAAIPEPVAAAPTGSAAFFPESETQPLRERWRDIQLRFVDDPKTSTGEAAALVDETIEKLTTALREHRGALAGGGDDTEALRVELRSYRDILDRLLGL